MAALPRMGVNRHFPRALVHSPMCFHRRGEVSCLGLACPGALCPMLLGSWTLTSPHKVQKMCTMVHWPISSGGHAPGYFFQKDVCSMCVLTLSLHAKQHIVHFQNVLEGFDTKHLLGIPITPCLQSSLLIIAPRLFHQSCQDTHILAF